MASFCFKPCQLLCQGCGELCKCVDKGCDCCCKACQAPCNALYGCCCPSDKPSPIFLTFSAVICGIGIVLAISGLTSSNSNCNQPITIFLVVGILINGALLLFAGYLYWQFSRPYGQDPENPNDNNPLGRAGQMFCYDPVVFVYMLALLAALIMAIMGAVWVGSADKAKCSSGARSAASSVVTCLWIYLLCGMVVIMISLCVECARVKEIQHQQAAQHPHHRISFMPTGPTGWMKRLFFPRHTVVVQQPGAARPPQNIPYAAAPPPQNIPYAANAGQQPAPHQPPVYTNTQGPAQGQPAGQQAQAGGNSLADLAAQGLRFGANLLQGKQQQQQQQQQGQAQRRDLGNAGL